MKVALYPGCLILYRFPEYEISARKLLESLGYEVIALSQTLCCGSYLEGINPHWYHFTAYNLALAEKQHVPLITLCGGCANTFKRVQNRLFNDPGLLDEINQKLKSYDLKVSQPIKVQHIIQQCIEDQEKIKQNISQPLSYKVAPVYPCQVYRPGTLMNFDNPLKPHSLDDLIQLTGATPQSYPSIHECCGSSLYQIQPDAAFSLGQRRIHDVLNTEADLLMTACGNCHLLLNRLQAQYNPRTPLPVIFLTQLLGLSFGLRPSELHLSRSQLKGWL